MPCVPHKDPWYKSVCNGRTDLQRPSEIYGGPKRLIFEVLMIFNNYLPGGFKMLPSRSQAVNTFDHHDRSGVKGLNMSRLVPP